VNAGLVVEPDAVAEQHRRDVNVELVDQSKLEQPRFSPKTRKTRPDA
jgi:hypothetical protein